MPRYQIVLERRAHKALHKAPPHLRRRLIQAIEALANEPRPHGAKALKATALHRIRVGSYRVVYQVRDAELVVLVVRVGDRKEVYRRLDDLAKRLPPPGDG